MTGHPRRTTELMGSSKGPTERKSRLAVPIRRTTQTGIPTSTTKRPQSVDRYSMRPTNSLLPPASTAKKTRSHSQTPRSAFQTPTTPGNRTPMSNSYLQSADKRGMVEDKLFIHQEAAKITDFGIRYNVQGFGKDTKLRNVTYKQFTGLVEFMLEKLVGNRFPLQGIDNIMKVLNIIDYPFSINKSWLKTPTAGHAFNHVVVMLGWLLNLVEPPLMPEGETELDDFECISNLVHDVDFPTIVYQKIFMEKAKEGFMMWNLQEDEKFEKLNEELANLVVAQSTNGTIESIKRLDDVVITLEKEQKELIMKAKPSTNHQECIELENEVKDLKRILEGKKEIVYQLLQSIAAEKNIYEDEKKILKQREAEILKLRTRIQNQIMSKNELKSIIEEHFLLRQAFEVEQKYFKELQDKNIKDPVEFSLLNRQKVQKINELNKIMYDLDKNFKGSISHFNPSELELNPNSPDLLTQLKDLKLTFNHFKVWLTEAYKIYKASRIETQTKIDMISDEFKEHQKKLKAAAEKIALELQGFNESLSSLEKKYAEIDIKYGKEKEENEKLKKEIAEIQKEVETEKLATSKVKEETQVIMKRFTEEHQRALDDLKDQLKNVKEKKKHYQGARDEARDEAIKRQNELKELIDSFGSLNN